MSYETQAKRVKVEPWDDGDSTITLDGKPIGQTLSRSDAATIARWLPSAIAEIVNIDTADDGHDGAR